MHKMRSKALLLPVWIFQFFSYFSFLVIYFPLTYREFLQISRPASVPRDPGVAGDAKMSQYIIWRCRRVALQFKVCYAR
jgi:hypothetical protein